MPSPGGCPLCQAGADHDEACRFGGGSLYCIRGDECRNPHHRDGPAALRCDGVAVDVAVDDRGRRVLAERGHAPEGRLAIRREAGQLTARRATKARPPVMAYEARAGNHKDRCTLTHEYELDHA